MLTPIFLLTKRRIDELDPLGLLAGGAPADEYDLESAALSRRLTPSNSLEEIADAMAAVFHHYFDIPEDPSAFTETARLLHEDIQTSHP